MKKLFLAVSAITLIAGPLSAATWHVSCPASGTGTCLTAGNACTFTTLNTKAVAPGDLILAYGTDGETISTGLYRGSTCMFAPNFDGTAAQPITLRANTYGGVVIDGQGVRTPMSIAGRDYLTIDGIDVCCNGSPATNIASIGNSSIGIVFKNGFIWDGLIDWNSNGFSFTNTPMAQMTGVVIEDSAVWGTMRKNAVNFQNTAGSSIKMRNVITAWDGSTCVGPKLGRSYSYFGKGLMSRDGISFWRGGSVPAVKYQLMNLGAVFASSTSTTSHSVTTGSKTFTTASAQSWSGVARMRAYRTSAAGTYVEGNITSSSGTSITINVNEVGGSGGPYTNWSINKVYAARAVDQPYAVHGFDSACAYLNTAARMYGEISIVRNADFFTPPTAFSLSGNGDIRVEDSVAVFGTSYSSKRGFNFGNCTSSSDSGCGTGLNGCSGASKAAKALFADTITTIGGVAPNIGTDWTATNVSTLATNATFNYTTRGVCFMHDDLGNVTTTKRWPWPHTARLQTRMTYSGYTPINPETEVVAALGPIPAACDLGAAATPTASNTPTSSSTPTPSRTNTSTPTWTPTRTFTRTNTPTSSATPTPTHTAVPTWTPPGPSFTPTFTPTATPTSTPSLTPTISVTLPATIWVSCGDGWMHIRASVAQAQSGQWYCSTPTITPVNPTPFVDTTIPTPTNTPTP